METSPTHSLRQGASAPNLTDYVDLPLVVWLRGDESYVEEFSCDADQAMEYLGIRRSRLTQISGRELRVARMRVGRYIKPYYREKDLEAYQSWSRATASHQKASNMVEEAADKLATHAQDMTSALSELQESTLTRTEGIIAEVGKQLGAAIEDFRQTTGSDRTLLFERLEKQHLALSLRLDELRSAVENLNSEMKSEIKALAELTTQSQPQLLEALSAHLEPLGSKQQSFEAAWQKNQTDTTKALSLILRFLQEQRQWIADKSTKKTTAPTSTVYGLWRKIKVPRRSAL
jgi:hypothetical protein